MNKLNKKVPLYKVYPVFGMILGLVFMLMIPIRTVPDETFHIAQAYEVSDVLLGMPSGSNPILIREEDLNNYNIPSHYTKKQYADYWASLNDPLVSNKIISSNSFKIGAPYPYFLSGIGITIGRGLKLGAGATLNLGRLFNLIAFVICGTLALWLMPFGCELMFVILLLPMTLQQSMSYSYDVLVFADAFLSIAFFLRINYNEKLKPKKRYIYLGIMIGLNCLIIPIKSHAYIFMVFLSIYSIVHIFAGNNKDKIWRTFWLIVCMLVLAGIIGWIIVASHPAIYPSVAGDLGYTTDPGFSVSYILHHPRTTIKVLFATIVLSSEEHLVGNLIGCNLEDLTLTLPGSFKFIFLMILLLSAFSSPHSEFALRRRTRITFLCIAVITIACIAVGMLISWTPLTSPIVQGIQGRYYIPIIFMLLILLNNRNIRISDNLHYSVVPAVIIMDIVVPIYIYATAA